MTKLYFEEEYKLSKEVILEVGVFLSLENNILVESSELKDIKLQQDKMSEKMIVDKLVHFNHKVLSEENYSDTIINDEDVVWIIDPIDGSMNFSRNNPSSCISIALFKGKEPIFGHIYDFNRKELISGHISIGVSRNDEKINVIPLRSIENAILATGFPTYLEHDTETLEHFIKQVQHYKKIRMIGSAALSLAYVALNRFDTYMEKNIKLWDIAAGLAINHALKKPIEIEYLDDYLVNLKVGVF